MAVTQEALCFVECYPDRKEELIRRIREGRVYVSPYLCNTLWGFQSAEGAIRAFYPARRLERDGTSQSRVRITSSCLRSPGACPRSWPAAACGG